MRFDWKIYSLNLKVGIEIDEDIWTQWEKFTKNVIREATS
jgi:hypothetical protein